jgi:hypothetical protein
VAAKSPRDSSEEGQHREPRQAQKGRQTQEVGCGSRQNIEELVAHAQTPFKEQRSHQEPKAKTCFFGVDLHNLNTMLLRAITGNILAPRCLSL